MNYNEYIKNIEDLFIKFKEENVDWVKKVSIYNVLTIVNKVAFLFILGSLILIVLDVIKTGDILKGEYVYVNTYTITFIVVILVKLVLVLLRNKFDKDTDISVDFKVALNDYLYDVHMVDFNDFLLDNTANIEKNYVNYIKNMLKQEVVKNYTPDYLKSFYLSMLFIDYDYKKAEQIQDIIVNNR